MQGLTQLAARTRVTQCLDCGKCTPDCPVAQHLPGFSPRRLIALTLNGDGTASLAACTACGACEVRCPSVVQFVDYVRDARRVIASQNGPRAHCGVFEAAARTGPGRDPRRHLDPDLKVQEQGEVLFFVGCAPLFDTYFSYLDVHTTKGASASVRVMNRLGVEPAVLTEELCCGHDQLWSGDREAFADLAHRNVQRIKETGAKQVVTACAECARCLGIDYPELIGDVPFETQHFTTWLAAQNVNGDLPMTPTDERVTFHDPCRLSRHLKETDAPRELLDRVPGLELVEMRHAGQDGLCCGTEGFSRCGAVSKAIQSQRLSEARDTGATTLLTACPKCQVHLACARHDADVEVDLDIQDLTEKVADLIGESGDGGNSR